MAKAPTRRRKAESTPPVFAMEDFQTRERANTGHRIPLYTPDGRLSSHWLQVRGVDSDAFTLARNRQIRRGAEIAAMPEGDREMAILEGQIEMQAALVASWSFDKPCTFENVKAFLREAPQIAAEVDKFASRRSLFFKMPLESLSGSPSHGSA